MVTELNKTKKLTDGEYAEEGFMLMLAIAQAILPLLAKIGTKPAIEAQTHLCQKYFYALGCIAGHDKVTEVLQASLKPKEQEMFDLMQGGLSYDQAKESVKKKPENGETN